MTQKLFTQSHLELDTVPELSDIIAAIEVDERLKVVVFDSAVNEFFDPATLRARLVERRG